MRDWPRGKPELTRDELLQLPIQQLLPLDRPMALLDRSISMTSETFETEVKILPESLFCDGTKVGAWIGMEYMAQTIGVFANAEALLRGEPLKAGFLLGSREYRCKISHFKVGTTLRILAKKLIHDPAGLGVLECSLRAADSPEALVTANLTLFEVADLKQFMAENT
jgi:3-oxoacyl-[acyl-carrier-protein] synthase-1